MQVGLKTHLKEDILYHAHFRFTFVLCVSALTFLNASFSHSACAAAAPLFHPLSETSSQSALIGSMVGSGVIGQPLRVPPPLAFHVQCVRALANSVESVKN